MSGKGNCLCSCLVVFLFNHCHVFRSLNVSESITRSIWNLLKVHWLQGKKPNTDGWTAWCSSWTPPAWSFDICLTHKFFPDFSAMKATLRKQPRLEGYDKSEGYYKKSPNIYDRLGGEEGIRMARNHAIPFSLEEAKSKGISEMNKFFEIFEKWPNKNVMMTYIRHRKKHYYSKVIRIRKRYDAR